MDFFQYHREFAEHFGREMNPNKCVCPTYLLVDKTRIHIDPIKLRHMIEDRTGEKEGDNEELGGYLKRLYGEKALNWVISRL